jgi:hypothetical protein
VISDLRVKAGKSPQPAAQATKWASSPTGRERESQGGLQPSAFQTGQRGLPHDSDSDASFKSEQRCCCSSVPDAYLMSVHVQYLNTSNAWIHCSGDSYAWRACPRGRLHTALRRKEVCLSVWGSMRPDVWAVGLAHEGAYTTCMDSAACLTATAMPASRVSMDGLL